MGNEGVRQRGRNRSCTDVEINRIECGMRNCHQDIMGTWRGRGNLTNDDGISRAVFRDVCCLHVNLVVPLYLAERGPGVRGLLSGIRHAIKGMNSENDHA